MKYLLDVNVLIALGFHEHAFHQRVASWLAREGFPPLGTCSITELGFIRILAQSPAYGLTLLQARELLLQFKGQNRPPFVFVPDDQDILHLPRWVITPKQTTDGHLLQLAAAHGAVLATLDERIPGAYIIP